MALLDLLGRRWTLRVIWELREEGAPTFRELQARCDGVSSSVLAARLRELGEAGLVAHDGDGYRLSVQGSDLLTRLASLDEWASTWRPARVTD
jgi:DNA-binding HxlR family transcriptional regulator